MTAALLVTVDHDRCVGSTMCVQLAGRVFTPDRGGQSVAGDPAGASRDEIIEAAAQCPMEAISVVDATSGQALFP
jgi:ferredoxin